MKKLTTFVLALVVVMGITAITGFAAAEYGSPAEAVAGLTGTALADVIAERRAGTTYYTMAEQAGVLEEYQAELLEQKKDRVAAMVESGRITQQQADAIIERFEANQAVCNGTGLGGGIIREEAGLGVCNGMGLGAGSGGGTGAGRGNGSGTGAGRGGGRGAGLHDGSCVRY